MMSGGDDRGSSSSRSGGYGGRGRGGGGYGGRGRGGTWRRRDLERFFLLFFSKQNQNQNQKHLYIP